MSKGEDRLVVVDMQPDFTHSSYCLQEVVNECVRAMKRGDTILIVEYTDDWGVDPVPKNVSTPTHEVILDAVRHYGYVRVVKSEDDGSEAIAKQAGISSGVHRLVGVNRKYCVERTANGLTGFGAEVKIIEDATA
jgi:nicotinamidase-related amidase